MARSMSTPARSRQRLPLPVVVPHNPVILYLWSLSGDEYDHRYKITGLGPGIIHRQGIRSGVGNASQVTVKRMERRHSSTEKSSLLPWAQHIPSSNLPWLAGQSGNGNRSALPGAGGFPLLGKVGGVGGPHRWAPAHEPQLWSPAGATLTSGERSISHPRALSPHLFVSHGDR